MAVVSPVLTAVECSEDPVDDLVDLVEVPQQAGDHSVLSGLKVAVLLGPLCLVRGVSVHGRHPVTESIGELSHAPHRSTPGFGAQRRPGVSNCTASDF